MMEDAPLTVRVSGPIDVRLVRRGFGKTRTEHDSAWHTFAQAQTDEGVMSKKRLDSHPTFVPSEFMRNRRPYLFSDSRKDQTPILTREVLEYHLETLTNRKEETTFEHFARKMAEKELCPNLLPQTGPTGGGDSKVDSETYPVSPSIALTWYLGIDLAAAQERWAFAFSAKKKWLSKLRSDVKKILETGRDYKLVYFITNQFVPDKRRAKVEDELKAEVRVPVRILDRTWIVTKVFDNNRIALAIEALGLAAGASLREVKGPHDTQREAELLALEAQIEDHARYIGVMYQLAEDCLESAILARGLERPRTEVDGRFDRAERIAAEVDYAQQRLRIAYARAWTAFWWHDDYEELNRIYGIVEQLANDSDKAEDTELLFNLWQLLHASVLRGVLGAEQAQVEARTATLKAALDRQVAVTHRLNNAMLARTNRLMLDLTEGLGNLERTRKSLEGLREVVVSSDRLVHYPLQRLSNLIREIGNSLPDDPAFDSLFEAITERMEKRAGEGAAGEALLQRGSQKLSSGLSYDAIRLFGRAQQKLTKREYRGLLVGALAGAANGYENVGLPWAARSSLISAVYFALSEFYETGAVIKPAVFIVQRLVWTELQLGRVTYALAWFELFDVLLRHIEASNGPQEKRNEERESQDLALSVLLLRATIAQLREMDFLPGVLGQLDLPCSRASLMYALGYEQRLRDEGWPSETENADAMHGVYKDFIERPEWKEFPETIELLSGREAHLRTRVLGCNIVCVTAIDLPSLYLAEAILGAVEAFLATSLNADIFPYRADFAITVERSETAAEFPTYELPDRGHLLVRHSVPVYPASPGAQSQFSDWLFNVVLQVLSHIAIPRDGSSYIEKIVGEERGVERSVNTAHIESIMDNIMGRDPKLRLVDWRAKFSGEAFPLTRTTPWNGQSKQDQGEGGRPAPKFGTGEAPPDLLAKIERGKHGDRRVVSVIDIPLWDKAEWGAVVFGHSLDGEPPLFGLAFEDREAACEIFAAWRARFGKVDEKDQIRISVLTGIDKAHPNNYRVVVATNILDIGSHELVVTTSRINSMSPADSSNLNRFRRFFARAGRYVLVPAHLRDPPEFLVDAWIGKRDLVVRPLWQVGENDPDIVAVHADDDPMVPVDRSDIPVLRAIERVKQKRTR